MDFLEEVARGVGAGDGCYGGRGNAGFLEGGEEGLVGQGDADGGVAEEEFF